MLAVIFEVTPAPGRKQEYLELAAQLRPELEKIEGFISVERFASLTKRSSCRSRSGATRKPCGAGATLRATARRRRAGAQVCLPITASG